MEKTLQTNFDSANEEYRLAIEKAKADVQKIYADARRDLRKIYLRAAEVR